MRKDLTAELVHRCIDGNPTIRRMEDESRRRGVLMEDLRSDVNKLIEIVMDNNRLIKEMAASRDTDRINWDRLDAVEDTQKRHIKNRKTHRSVETP